jgi:hypothetical protein
MIFNWLKSAFPKTQIVGDVMSTYGELLETYPLSIVDVSMLPLPKTKMKVFLKALYATARTAEQQRLVEKGFLFLSQFQDGVGPKPIDGTLLKGDAMQNLDTNVEIIERWTPWQKLSLAEMDILAAEWKQFKEGELTVDS